MKTETQRPMRTLVIEGMTLQVPQNLRPSSERPFAASYLHRRYGGDEMRAKAPQLYAEFHGEQRVLKPENANASLFGYFTAMNDLGETPLPHFEHSRPNVCGKVLDAVELMQHARVNPAFMPSSSWDNELVAGA